MKRTKEEILVSVLEICLIDANKTAIVYRSNLNFVKTNLYLESLIKKGFIAVIEGPPRMYKTTDKGKELLSRLKELHEIF